MTMEYASTQFYAASVGESDPPRAAESSESRPRRPSEPGVELAMRLGQYRILGELGQGGFGTIWHGIDDATGREVAIKVLRSEYVTHPDIIARFQREAQVVSMLQHPNIVNLYELGRLDDGTPYLVMEYLTGTSLYAHLREERVLAPEVCLEILQQLSDALSAAHERGVIHRDIKASNVMLCEQPDGSQRVVLLDFGIAKLLEGREPPITAPLTTIGSPHFMAPEQIYGRAVDARTDVYGLGILTFELLAGELPFQGTSCEVLYRHTEAQRPALSQWDESLRAFDGVVQRAMALHPDDRHPDVGEFLAEFRGALAAHRGLAPPDQETDRPVRAIGFYIQAAIDADAAAACTDAVRTAQEGAAMDDVALVLTRSHRFLTRRGFISAYEYGNVSLFALPINGTAASVRKRSLAVARELRGALAIRTGAHPWVSLGIHLEVGVVRFGDRDERTIAGGALVDKDPPPIPRPGAISLTVSPELQPRAVAGD